MRTINQRVFSWRGYSQTLFFIGLLIWVWFFPSDIFEGTWLDLLLDTVGIGGLFTGELIRIWAVSHAGKCTRSRKLKAEVLIKSGPYAIVRNPIYGGNFLIGLGMVILSEAFVLIPVFIVLFSLQYMSIIANEEEFLARKFGADYANYRSSVPKWIPRLEPLATRISLGSEFPINELGTALGVIVGGFFFEWIESPLHRLWVTGLWYWLQGTVQRAFS